MFNFFRSAVLFIALTFVFFACGDQNKSATTTTTTATATTASTTTTATTATPSTTVATTADPFEQFVADFKAAAASGDAKKMAALCVFPLETTQTEAEFLSDFDNYFDADGKKRISESAAKDWTDTNDAKSFAVSKGSGAIIYAKKQGNSYKITAIMMAG
jgi:hypothetical protein